MTDKHQGLPVFGYKSQPSTAIDEVNRNKALEEVVLRRLDDVRRIGAAIEADPRWLAIAQTQLEQGFMALNRAIFRPGRFEGGDDVLAEFMKGLMEK